MIAAHARHMNSLIRQSCNERRISLTSLFILTDDQMNDGMNRETFLEAVNHVITNRFWWNQVISSVVIHEYTNWSRVSDPYVNRENYIQVSLTMINTEYHSN